jgi:hypothetical protein
LFCLSLGHRVYVVEDWLLESERVVRVLLEATGNNEDQVLVSVFKINQNATLSQLENLNGTFFKSPVAEGYFLFVWCYFD